MARFSALFSAIPFAFALAACSAAHDGTPGGPNPAPTTPPPADTSVATQHGVVTDYETDKPVQGATVSSGDQSVVTDAKGAYALPVKKGQAFKMVVTAPSYVKLMEQETTLTADYDRGTTTIVPMSMTDVLHATLDGYDATLGVLSVAVLPSGNCKSVEGTTIHVSPAGTSKMHYMVSKLPSHTQTHVKDGEFPSAVLYNLQPGVPITVTIESETCKQAAFPVVTPAGITYGATVTTEPGDVTSFQRLFLE